MEGGLLLPLPLWTEYSCDTHWRGSEIVSFPCGTRKWTIKILACCTAADSNIHTYIHMPSKHCCVTRNVFMELTVTYSLATHMKCTTVLLVITMHHNVVCTLPCSLFYMHIHLGIRISYLLTNTTHPSYMKRVNTLQLDSHQHTIMDTISIIHKLFLDKLKGMGKCRVFPIWISLCFIYTFFFSSRILINGRSFYMQTK